MGFTVSAFPLIIRQRDMFNILVPVGSIGDRELCKKVKLVRYFDKGYILVAIKHVK